MGNRFTINGPDKETINAAKDAQRKLKDANVTIMDIYTFQTKVLSGEISDDKGIAELIINNSVSNYHIHINRKCVTKSDGTLITYAGIMKMYKPEELKIKYTKRPKRMMSVAQLKQLRKERNKVSISGTRL
ncbi:hypothetical protein [Pseudobutyrivibrio ruminis]|uniref:hypothetical protein n=1 Tax=Pseudobutyrivibrio ruminis TaxID=46206 RepID=UPI0003F5DB54|nr:hypothetical protein [Pseudobutyrivibrio ruminis]